jgi:hypothetical protein
MDPQSALTPNLTGPRLGPLAQGPATHLVTRSEPNVAKRPTSWLRGPLKIKGLVPYQTKVLVHADLLTTALELAGRGASTLRWSNHANGT